MLINLSFKLDKCILLDKEGYDPFIDFTKGWSIICVVLTHAITPKIHDLSLFFLWGDWAVPLFLLIQVFHSYKHGEPKLKLPWKKMLKRIFLPFIGICLLIYFLKCLSLHNLKECANLLYRGALNGGFGPGCYYPWIYIQFFILLPIFYKLLRHNILWGGCCAILAEMVCSLVDMPEWFYRLFFIRYVFLIVLGYLWVRKGIRLNLKTLSLSIISIAAIVIFQFCNYDTKPWFYNSSWKIFHWICYFYPATLLVFLIKWLYERLPQRIITFVKICGADSYNIYVCQMFVFSFAGSVIAKIYDYYDIALGGFATYFVYFTLSVGASILMPIIFKNLVARKKTATA